MCNPLLIHLTHHNITCTHSPPHRPSSLPVAGLPTPIVWHALHPQSHTQQQKSRACTLQPCCFRLCHSAFDSGPLFKEAAVWSGLHTGSADSSVAATAAHTQQQHNARFGAASTAAAAVAAATQQHTQAANANVFLPNPSLPSSTPPPAFTTHFSHPSYAVGLLALAHASEVEVQKYLLLSSTPLTSHKQNPTSPSPTTLPVTQRVNWSLLHQYPSAARTAAVWREVCVMCACVCAYVLCCNCASLCCSSVAAMLASLYALPHSTICFT